MGSSPTSGTKKSVYLKNLAYIVGVALGDGNLSNPNRRAVRLRITCDIKYQKLINEIREALSILLPLNKIGVINRKGCIDLSIYSNQLPKLLGWQWDGGSKDNQNVEVPAWIKNNKEFSKLCLRGLLQTDGSIYKDRGYIMVNFVNTSKTLISDVFSMIQGLGYQPNLQKKVQRNGKVKHTIRVSKSTEDFIKEVGLWKK